MNVVSYLRVSGASQIDGDGFERQSKAIKFFCDHNKLNIFSEFKEEGVSGTIEGIDRPRFSAALAACEVKEIIIDAIVVERMDRLARDLMVSELILKECRERGVKIFSADQGNLTDMASDGGDPTRVLIRQLMGALAQWEKSVLVKKLRAARDRKKAAGGFIGGVSPYGFSPEEKPILDLILKEHTAGGQSYSQITRLLNSMGCLPRCGRVWREQNVRTIILNAKQKQQSNPQKEKLWI